MTDSLPRLIPPLFSLGNPSGIIASMQVMSHTSAFAAICSNVPRGDVSQLQAAIANARVEELRAKIVLVRFCNAVCNTCRQKDASKLLACARCQMTFYCTKDCQTRDWSAHQQWCCNADADADTGPLRIVLLRKT